MSEWVVLFFEGGRGKLSKLNSEIICVNLIVFHSIAIMLNLHTRYALFIRGHETGSVQCVDSAISFPHRPFSVRFDCLRKLRWATCQLSQNKISSTAAAAAAMGYKWEPHRQTCYRLYVDEQMSLDEVVEYMRVHRNFTPRSVLDSEIDDCTPTCFPLRTMSHPPNIHSVFSMHTLQPRGWAAVPSLKDRTAHAVEKLTMATPTQSTLLPDSILPMGLPQQVESRLQG